MDNKWKILMPLGAPPAAFEVLKNRPDVEAVVLDKFTTEEFHAALKDAHGVTLSLTPFREAECQAAPNMKVVARMGVGYDTVDVPALTRHKLPLMVTGIANSVSVAECAFFMMSSLAKRGRDYDILVRENRWADRRDDLPVDLAGRSVLVVGFGRIGSRVAPRCKAFDMAVMVYDPFVPAERIRAAGFEPVADLKTGLARADFVTVHCPKSSATINLIGAAELAAMKPTAYIVNTARGGIINEDALYDALKARAIKAAGLDVLDIEPPTAVHKLASLDNVLLAPHMAGVTAEAMDRMARTMIENILSVFDGKPNVDNVINKEVLG